MGALDKLKSRMSGPGKTPLGRPTEPVSEQVSNNASINQTKKNIASAGQFIAQEGAGQALKKFAGNFASKALGVAGMLLSSQKVYGGGDFKSGTYISPKEQKEQFESIPEETSEQFQARTQNKN